MNFEQKVLNKVLLFLLFCLILNNKWILSVLLTLNALKFSFTYLGESKVLQYFGNMKHNSVAPDTFVEMMNVSNLSPRAVFYIYFHSLDYGLAIQDFMPI